MCQVGHGGVWTDDERDTPTTGLRSPDAFTLRRCQIALASARGEHASQIARQLGCSEQGARNAIAAFNRAGLVALTRRSSRPATIRPAFDADDRYTRWRRDGTWAHILAALLPTEAPT